MPPVLRHTATHLLKNWRIGLPTVLVIAFAFLLLNLILFTNHVGKSFLNVMKGSLSFTVYVEETIDPFSLRAVIEYLETLPEVTPPVVYTSPEEARMKFRLQGNNGNNGTAGNFPGVIMITPKEPDDRVKIEQRIEKSPYRSFISILGGVESFEGKTYERVKQQIERLQKLIQSIMIGLLAFSLLVIATVIFASLKLGSFSRRRELAIMKLVGASPYFLELPYLLEAISYSVLGLLIGSVVFLLLPNFGFLPADQFLQNEWRTFSIGQIFILELLLALLLGFLAGSFSIRKIVEKSTIL